MLEKLFFSEDYLGENIEIPIYKFSAVQGFMLDSLKFHTGCEWKTTVLLFQWVRVIPGIGTKSCSHIYHEWHGLKFIPSCD